MDALATHGEAVGRAEILTPETSCNIEAGACRPSCFDAREKSLERGSKE
jgi:hypothetical protein